MRTVAVRCTDNYMDDRVVLLTPIYAENLKYRNRHIRASMSNGRDGIAVLLWLPIFTEWWND